MSPATFWLGRGTIFGVTLTLSLSAWAAFGERSSPGRVAAREYAAHLDRHLAFLRSTISGMQVLWAQILVAAAAVVVALAFGKWPALLFVPAVALGPKLLIERQVARRVAKLEEQIGPLSAINDVNNWLGRSQFAVDPALGASIAEFRIYDVALGAGEIQRVRLPWNDEISVI